MSSSFAWVFRLSSTRFVGGINELAFRYLKRNSLGCAKDQFRSRINQFFTSALENPVVSRSRSIKPPTVLLLQSITTMGDPEARKKEIEARKAELKKRLTPLQYHVTQEKGTERAYTGKYYKTSEAGIYSCIVCEEPLFSSETKFDSGCGWPAFNEVLAEGKVKLLKDTSNDCSLSKKDSVYFPSTLNRFSRTNYELKIVVFPKCIPDLVNLNKWH